MTGNEDIWLPQWPQGYKPSFRYNKPTFECHVGKSGNTWLIPAVTRLPNRGDHLYVTEYPDVTRVGKGFSGAILHMPLINGRDFELRGGWHGNSKLCYKDTGVDTRNQHLTFGAIAVHRTGYSGLFGILYEDKKPRIGKFDRIEQLAQEMANERNERVYYSVLSYGGGASGWKEGGK